MSLQLPLLIANGTLVSKDHARLQGDVLVSGERIASVAPHIPLREGWKLIEAAGKVVAPGFMNIHSHADFHLPIAEHARLYERLLYQGITTNVGGQCGFCFFPIRRERRKELNDYQGFLLYRDLEPEWEDCQQYFDFLEGGMRFNYAQLAGHGTLRVNAAGFSERLDREQMRDMTRLLEESLEAGCFGLSSGLMYMPGTFADTAELVTLARAARRHPNTFYASHLRGYSATFLEAVAEAIQVGREADIPVQVSHLGPFGVKNGHKIRTAIELMEKARREGVDVAYDSLAYCGSDTLAIALFPPSSYSRGLDKFLQDIRDDSFWNDVVQRLQTYVPQWPSWEGNGWTDNFVECCGLQNIHILGSRDPAFIGKNFVSLGAEWKVGPWEALRRVVLAERADFKIFIDGIGGELYGSPEQPSFDAMIEHPLCINSVDEIYDRSGRSWLEAWGSFPHVVRRYVREKKTLALQTVIERFSSRVAERLGIADRGYLREGCFADIVVLDLENYSDHPALFAQEPRQATGVEQLLINGTQVIENGRLLRVLPGRLIRNGA
jgi:N-acyl-D-aspartate/D-glutamate deacylase